MGGCSCLYCDSFRASLSWENFHRQRQSQNQAGPRSQPFMTAASCQTESKVTTSPDSSAIHPSIERYRQFLESQLRSLRRLQRRYARAQRRAHLHPPSRRHARSQCTCMWASRLRPQSHGHTDKLVLKPAPVRKFSSDANQAVDRATNIQTAFALPLGLP
jgi:hypothetical protein